MGGLVLNGFPMALGVEAFALELLDQRGSIELQKLGGSARHPVGLAQRFADQAVLLLFQFFCEIDSVFVKADEMVRLIG